MLALSRQERGLIVFLLMLASVGLGAQWIGRCCGRDSVSCINRNIGRIDLNSADTGLLLSVRGIGPVLAGRIIAYRSQHGGFKDAAELTRIKGFSRDRYEKIRGLVFVR